MLYYNNLEPLLGHTMKQASILELNAGWRCVMTMGLAFLLGLATVWALQ